MAVQDSVLPNKHHARKRHHGIQRPPTSVTPKVPRHLDCGERAVRVTNAQPCDPFKDVGQPSSQRLGESRQSLDVPPVSRMRKHLDLNAGHHFDMTSERRRENRDSYYG